MFLKGREKAYGEVFKENFQNRKDQKENYDIVYCCHRIDVNRNNIGGNYVVLYDKACIMQHWKTMDFHRGILERQ